MTWTTIKTISNGVVERVATCKTRKQAIDTAITWADEDGRIRNPEDGEDFMALRNTWSREELREQLETDGFFTDEDESRVTVKQTE